MNVAHVSALTQEPPDTSVTSQELQNFFDISQHISNSLLPLNAARELQRLESQTRWITNYEGHIWALKFQEQRGPAGAAPVSS